MITINAVLSFNGKEIVPVRAIPFVTGGDMSPKCLAGILADPDSWLLAFVLGSNNATTMLPKNWKQYYDRLSIIARQAGDLDLNNQAMLEILPPSTFVYWEALCHTHENYFLPSRQEIEHLPPAEQANYELQPNAIIPRGLVNLVFEGFSIPSDSSTLLKTELVNALIPKEFAGQCSDDKSLNFDLLATRDQLMLAFGTWGLKLSWFRELDSHSWLKAARRLKGHGQRSHVTEPLFCPLAVMNGLATCIRGRPRLSLEKGWGILDHHFPNVSHANSFADPREQTG